MKEFKNIAVLIDADNTQYSKVPDVLREISTHGRIAVKRAYGNWQKESLGQWKNLARKYAIHAIQQYDYVSGKNATDIALVIDTLDLLYKGIYDAFVIVSSDSDYTPLAIRLQESGLYVMGVGKESTADSFKKACDDFIVLENMSNEIIDQEDREEAPEEVLPDAKEEPMEEIHFLLQDAYNKYKDENDYVNIGAVGSYIKRIKPDFDTRTYGYKKLTDLISDFPQKYRVQTAGHGFHYKCLCTPEKEDIDTVHKLLRNAYVLYKDETGFAHIGPTGTYVKNKLPNFNFRQHGYKNITDLLMKFPKRYRIKRSGSSVLYRCIT